MQWTRILGAPAVPAWIIGLVFIGLLGATPEPRQPQPAAETAFAVEYYYKVKWGHFDEFLALYKKNHYPILVKLQEMGRIVDMRADRPFNHASEAARWDFRFTIVWKDAATAHDLDFDDDPIIAALYPDRETFVKEEQRRFALLIEHMDVPVVPYDLSTW
jgi:hypothetical protein